MKTERKKMNEEKQNFAYMVRCADGTFYCGWTNDLDRRIRTHNEGLGAKYTRSRRPVTLVYWEEFSTRGEAMRREAAMKKLTRKEKEALLFTKKGLSEERPGIQATN